MKKQLLIITAFAVAAITQASLTWTGGGDGGSLFAENNWLDDNSQIPAANTINPYDAVTAATGGLILIDSGVGTPGNAGAGDFHLGEGNDLQVGGGKTLGLVGMGLRGHRTAAPNNTATVLGSSFLFAQWIATVDVVLDESSTVRVDGGGAPMNSATINVLDTDSLVQFSNETYADFVSEHIARVTFNGAALEFGADPLVVEEGDNAFASAFNGAAGVQIQMIPEPATLGLVAVFGAGILVIRRKLML